MPELTERRALLQRLLALGFIVTGSPRSLARDTASPDLAQAATGAATERFWSSLPKQTWFEVPATRMDSLVPRLPPGFVDLGAEGFSAVTASGGLEGLKLAKELRPVAITLDVMMPDLDGWSVLAALRQDTELAEIPVIMVTILDEQRRATSLGAAGYLTKPIDQHTLQRMMGRFRTSARPTRILLVEDDALQRELMCEWLVGEQWTVHEAGNGREALALLRANKPDVILLDLMMPEMDGFQIVAALQEEPSWRDVPVIVITARDLNAKDRERLNSGVHSVLLKNTFRPDELVERIRELTRTKSATALGATT